MKKILLLLSVIFLSGNTNAQVFSENFDSGSDLATLGWTTIDNDALTVNSAITYITTGWNNIDRAGTDGNFGGPALNFAAMSTSWYDTPGTSDDWLISPSITLPTAPATLVWDAKAQDNTTYQDGYELRISTNGGNTIADFTTVLFSIAAEDFNWTNHQFSLSAYVGQTVRFAWVNNSTDMFVLLVDNISVVTCAAPTNILANNITTTSADIAWDAIAGTTGYEYVFDTTATDPTAAGTITTNTTYSATPLTPNTVYYFHVRNICSATSSSSWSTKTFTTLAIAPVNDDCSNAIVMACGDVLTAQTTEGATGGTATSCIGTIGNEIWYKFAGTGLQVTLTAVASADAAQIQVYESTDGTCAGFTPGTCFASAGTGSTTTTVLFNSILGKQYFIQIGSWINGNPATVFDLSLTCAVPPTAPANDLCAGAIALTPAANFAAGVQAGTISASTTTAGITPSCQASFSQDVWYTVVVPASGNVTIETQTATANTMTDSVVAAFSGTCGALTQVGCDDDSGLTGVNNFMSVLSLTGQTPGATLYVGVWKYNTTASNSTNSNFQISAYDASLATSSFNNAYFSALPNPVKDVLTLSYNKAITNVAVFNLLGQQVITKSVNENQSQIDMSNLSAGTYMVKVTSENEVKTIKVIKE